MSEWESVDERDAKRGANERVWEKGKKNKTLKERVKLEINYFGLKIQNML